MPNLAAGVWQDAQGAVVIVVENAIAPTNAEWNGYCEQVARAVSLANASGIAITDGGGPNTPQRGQINDLLAGRQAPSAVISDSRMIRGIVTALSWFNKKTYAFSPNEIMKALTYTGVEGDRGRKVWELILQLNAQISPSSATVKEAARHVRF
jgi:hypothetical protein